VHDVGQLFDRAQIGRCRFVDQLNDHLLALGDPALSRLGLDCLRRYLQGLPFTERTDFERV
jgi:hypothetical protein